MPALGADMATAHLIEWQVKPGDRVKRGDVIAVVETEKGVIDAESFETGVVERILVPAEGQELPVGTPLAVIRDEGEPVGEPTGAGPSVAPPPVQVPSGPVGPPAERVRVSPVARKLAEELGVDLSTIPGTGPGGAIQRGDVERAAAAAPAAAEPATEILQPAAARRRVDPYAGMRDAIARAMARSKREIPHYYLARDIDMQRALAWLEEENRKRPVAERLLTAAILIKAVALALRDAPELNGSWVDEAFHPSEAVHVGVAISLRQGGLIAPALHHADLLPIDELMRALRDLVMRARNGGLRSSELTDPTITVTNLGEAGISQVFGVIYPPQVALVGFGGIAERPWSVGGLLGVRRVVTATLSADHRASDGQRGAHFLDALDRLLQEPTKL